MPDEHKNFAYSLVLTAPTAPAVGTQLTLVSDGGLKFPAPPFNATIWPASAQPTSANAEIVRVTVVNGDTLTIVRTQESSSARSIQAGDQIAATVTKKTLEDIELSLPTENDGDPNGIVDGNKARQLYDTDGERYWRKTTDAGTLTGWV